MIAAVLNPIKFYDPSLESDYISVFPNIYNTPFGYEYIYGVNANKKFLLQHIGTMYLQFQAELSDNMTILIYRMNDDGSFVYSHSLLGVNISPSGWVSKPIYKHTIELDAGIYFLKFNDGYYSDPFRVHSIANRTTNSLVKLRYSHSFNKFGCIFNDHFFTAYFMGQLVQGNPRNEMDVVDGDGGELINLRSTPTISANLTIISFYSGYVEFFNRLFSCDSVSVNDIDYSVSEPPEWNPVKGGDTGEVSIKLIQQNNEDYWSRQSTVPQEVYEYAQDYDDDIFTDFNDEKFQINID